MAMLVLQELCLGGTLAGFMQSGGLTTALGGVHIQRILSLLLDMAHGIMHLHACGHTGGDVDPSHVWLQLQESEDAGQGTTLNSIDESSIDTGACTSGFGFSFGTMLTSAHPVLHYSVSHCINKSDTTQLIVQHLSDCAGPPNHVGLPARMHALQRATNSSGRSAVARSADSDGGPSSLPHAVMATGSSTATLDAYGAARMAVEFDTRWRPDYSSVGPLVGTGRCVAKIAECGWCVAKGCARKSSVAASGAASPELWRLHTLSVICTCGVPVFRCTPANVLACARQYVLHAVPRNSHQPDELYVIPVLYVRMTATYTHIALQVR